MRILNIPHEGYASQCYVLVTDDNRHTCLVDPSQGVDAFRHAHPTLPMPAFVLLTHVHYDHMIAIGEWAEAGVPILVPRTDVATLLDPRANVSIFFGVRFAFKGGYQTVEDGDILPLGNEQIRVMHTPGHTPGSTAYLTGKHLLSGDTLFADGGVGRTDLPGGSREDLKTSIEKLLSLPTDTVVYPGHNRTFTIGQERLAHFTG